MNWKKYLIRAVKYVVYFYVFGFLLYALIYFVSGKQHLGAPLDFSALIKPKLLVGLALLGICYPAFGFSSVNITLPQGGWDKHGQPLHEVMDLCQYKFVKNEDGKLVFCADSPMRRVLNMFEDAITLELNGDELRVSGLRKEVAKVRLRVEDYVRKLS